MSKWFSLCHLSNLKLTHTWLSAAYQYSYSSPISCFQSWNDKILIVILLASPCHALGIYWCCSLIPPATLTCSFGMLFSSLIPPATWTCSFGMLFSSLIPPVTWICFYGMLFSSLIAPATQTCSFGMLFSSLIPPVTWIFSYGMLFSSLIPPVTQMLLWHVAFKPYPTCDPDILLFLSILTTSCKAINPLHH